MKKFISIIICAIVAAIIAVAFAKSVEKSATLFNQNVNALTRNSGVTGGCKGESVPCIIFRPTCGSCFEAAGYSGPAYNPKGICPVCDHKIG